jgi:hypothetical protein
LLERHAELVLRLAGGDLVVGLGVDVGIHAEGDASVASACIRHGAQRAQLCLRFHVERENAGLKRERHLLFGLADAREGDPLWRHADGERPAELAFGNDVHASPELGQGGEHAEIGVGLDGVADERALVRSEGFGEHPIVTLERCGRIAVERRACGVGQRAEVDPLGV